MPISFVYGGQRIAGIPQEWGRHVVRRRTGPHVEETICTGRDPRTGLQVTVESQTYADYPVTEWTAWLRNDGAQASPVIADLAAMDIELAGARPILHRCNGDFYSADGYTPEEIPLTPGTTIRCSPRGGRPCDGAFPYFRLVFPGGGVSIAVGWPAQWAAVFTGVGAGVRVRAGQEHVHLRLFPGERLRTPRMALLSWVGDTSSGINLWRRWYRDHVLPHPDGRPLQPLLACSCNDGGEEFTQATEENQLRFMDAFRRHGFDFDIWWIDAGWYPCRDEHGERHWTHTGTWEPDPERFPRGLRPVADRAAAYGARLLLWFEPERVVPGSWLDRAHPEWLLSLQTPGPGGATTRDRLLDLGNPECRRWLTDHVSRLISEQGIGVYRQDFNFAPLPYWQEHDAADRRGWHENQHVQGYLRYWDDLLAAHPGLWIDSCASGGRRNDLETMRRSVPLHYSDYGYGIHPVKLAFQHTLLGWLPYFKESALSWDTLGPGEDRWFNRANDAFAYHCAMAGMLATAFDIRGDSGHHGLSRQMIAVWRRAAPTILFGDYHPLTPFSREADRWVVRQFDCPERGEGLIQGIRLQECPTAAITVHPRALRRQARYLLHNLETGQSLESTGAALADAGFTLALPPRSGSIWFYEVRGSGV